MTAVATPMRVVIVDDEHIARQRVRRLLEKEGGLTIVAECATGLEAVAAVEEAIGRTFGGNVIYEIDASTLRLTGPDGHGLVLQAAE